jgi:hypothetical protein
MFGTALPGAGIQNGCHAVWAVQAVEKAAQVLLIQPADEFGRLRGHRQIRAVAQFDTRRGLPRRLEAAGRQHVRSGLAGLCREHGIEK